jgi:hypothetical protein
VKCDGFGIIFASPLIGMSPGVSGWTESFEGVVRPIGGPWLGSSETDVGTSVAGALAGMKVVTAMGVTVGPRVARPLSCGIEVGPTGGSGEGFMSGVPSDPLDGSSDCRMVGPADISVDGSIEDKLEG